MAATERAEYRAKRRARCEKYLRLAGSIPATRALAKKDGYSENFSVWIGALSDMLHRGAVEGGDE